MGLESDMVVPTKTDGLNEIEVKVSGLNSRQYVVVTNFSTEVDGGEDLHENTKNKGGQSKPAEGWTIEEGVSQLCM